MWFSKLQVMGALAIAAPGTIALACKAVFYSSQGDSYGDFGTKDMSVIRELKPDEYKDGFEEGDEDAGLGYYFSQKG